MDDPEGFRNVLQFPSALSVEHHKDLSFERRLGITLYKRPTRAVQSSKLLYFDNSQILVQGHSSGQERAWRHVTAMRLAQSFGGVKVGFDARSSLRKDGWMERPNTRIV